MLKTYIRETIEEYLQEIDLTNAANIIMMDIEDLLEEIVEDIIIEIFIKNFLNYYFILKKMTKRN